MKALRQGSRAHFEGAGIDGLSPRSSAMLLFYAAECGLKALLMRVAALRDTSMLDPGLRSHDLRRLAKDLNMPKEMWVEENLTMTVANGIGRTVHISDLHTVWRYGGVIPADEHRRAVQALSDMVKWCEER